MSKQGWINFVDKYATYHGDCDVHGEWANYLADKCPACEEDEKKK